VAKENNITSDKIDNAERKCEVVDFRDHLRTFLQNGREVTLCRSREKVK